MKDEKQSSTGLNAFLKFQKQMVDRIVWPYPKDGIFRWRALILFSILSVGMVLSLFAFIAAVALIVKEDVWGLAVADTLGILTGLAALFVHRVRYEVRAAVACLACYMIGIAVILSVGPLSGGPAWLFAFPVLAGVLIGNYAAFAAIFMNAVFLSIAGLLISTGKLGQDFPFFNTHQAMVAAGVNFIVVNFIAAISVSVLVKRIFQLYEEKEDLAKGLEQERRELVQTKRSLESEIRAREQKEIRLKESETRFRELAELLPETIYEVDLTGKLTFVNQRAFDLFGHTREDFENGINVFELICEKDQKSAFENVQKILRGEKVGISEYEIRRKDGSHFPALFHSSVIYNDGRPSGLRGFLINMTEKKRTQEILVQNEKMMSVGGLAAGMAHEINNPLAGMIQNAQVAYNRLTSDMPKNEAAAKSLGTTMEAISKYMEARGILQHLTHIKQAGLRAARIVENMLSFAKKKETESIPHDLAELVEVTLEILENDYDLKKEHDFKNIKVVKQFEPGLPWVRCDSSKIQQVIMNIVKNSVEAASQPPGKSKDLCLQFGLRKDGDMIRMEIEDNGPGIEEDIRKRIFEPFFTTKSVDKGVGLGLSLSYFIIVDNHKGEMQVESTPGIGTRFIIRLPL